MGIEDILEAVIARMPPPKRQPGRPAARDDHRQLVRQLRRRGDAGSGGRRRAQEGRADSHDGDQCRLPAEQLGVFTPEVGRAARAAPGRRGRLHHRRHQGAAGGQGGRHHHAGKEAAQQRRDRPPRPCPASRRSSRRSSPACIPTEASEYDQLRDALEKLKLNDSSLRYEPEVSRRWASASAAASWACCTWRSCRSAWSASSTRT